MVQAQRHLTYLGGGSVTRFAKVMKDGPDTKELTSREKRITQKMRDFVKQWIKIIPMQIDLMLWMIQNTKN